MEFIGRLGRVSDRLPTIVGTVYWLQFANGDREQFHYWQIGVVRDAVNLEVTRKRLHISKEAFARLIRDWLEKHEGENGGAE